jgi:ABC-type glycerol-3-phosphate transport system permease component
MKQKIHLRGQLFTYILLSSFSLMALLPFVWAFFSSFKNTTEIFTNTSFFPNIWRWQNYANAWRIGNLGTYFWNSIVVTAFTVGILLCIASLAGYSFAKLKLRRHPWVFYLYLVGLAVPVQVTVLSVFFILKSIHLHNTLWGLIIALIADFSAFSTFLMRNFFMEIPDSLGESANMDGSTPLRTFTSIYLPLAQPAILALMIFGFLYAWNEFYLSLMILTDDKYWTIPLAVTAFSSLLLTDYSLVFAAFIISVIPTIVFYIVFQRSFVNGITAGALKA